MSRGEGGSAESLTGAPQPEAGTPAEFITALRALRTWSGLTYRQLEGKTTAFESTLPASTIATTLGRATLPREPFVDAFTRACGLGDEQVRQWLDARMRIALGNRAQTDGHTEDDHTDSDQTGDDRAPTPGAGKDPPQPRSRRWRRAAGLVAAVGVGIAGTLGVRALPFDADPPQAAPSTAPSAVPVPGLAILAVGSWARIHPARTPELCLTEGRDRTQRYPTAIAAQHPCAQAVLPRTFIEPLGDSVVQIHWHHPKYGIGCLTMLPDGAGRDMLEPRDDCAEDNPAQRFRIEPIGPPAAAHFRIRPAITDQCLSLHDQDTTDGAEIVQGRCSGAADQEYLIELIPPP